MSETSEVTVATDLRKMENSRRFRPTTVSAVMRARLAKPFLPPVVPQANGKQPARNP